MRLGGEARAPGQAQPAVAIASHGRAVEGLSARARHCLEATRPAG
jgi:hypothetical protein